MIFERDMPAPRPLGPPSKKAAFGGSLWTRLHKDICRVLSKWREDVKDGVAPDSCTADLVVLLKQQRFATNAAIQCCCILL